MVIALRPKGEQGYKFYGDCSDFCIYNIEDKGL
jgi:hypothetical protein